ATRASGECESARGVLPDGRWLGAGVASIYGDTFRAGGKWRSGTPGERAAAATGDDVPGDPPRRECGQRGRVLRQPERFAADRTRLGAGACTGHGDAARVDQRDLQQRSLTRALHGGPARESPWPADSRDAVAARTRHGRADGEVVRRSA